MGPNGRLLVRLKVGHMSQLLDPALPNGHTHRWTVFVRAFDNEHFKDRSFVEKVCFNLHVDFPNPKRLVKEPPFEVTETGYAGFTIPLQIWLAGKQYKVQYDLNLTYEPRASYFTTATISVDNYTPEFYSIAKRFGAERMKRSRERELLGVPGFGGSTPSAVSPPPPPEKIRKKERSADVSARNSPVPMERLKIRMDERERDVRKAESSSISPPIRKEERRKEEAASTPPTTDPKERKKKESKLLGFVLDRGAQQLSRPSPAASPAVVEKLRKEEKRKDVRGSASPSTSGAVDRLKKEERKREKIGSSPSAFSEREKKKEKNGPIPSPPEKLKEKDADRSQRISLPEKQKDRNEKAEKEFDRLVKVSADKNRAEKEKERDPSSYLAETASASASVSSKREKERTREKQKDRDRPKDPSLPRQPPSGLSDWERRKELQSSVTPPPVLLRQECAPSSVGGSSIRRSTSPPKLEPVGNGRSSDYASRAVSSSYAYGGSIGSTVASHQTMSAGSIPSLLTTSIPPPPQLGASSSHGMLQEPSPSGSLGGRETPSEKASRSSISPALRNEETASSGGSSACSHSSGERREQKRIPKLANSQRDREREALSVPLSSVDASTVRRRIESLTDPDRIFDVAFLLLDLDSSSSISHPKHSLPSLTFDLSNLDQRELLRLDSVLNGS